MYSRNRTVRRLALLLGFALTIAGSYANAGGEGGGRHSQNTGNSTISSSRSAASSSANGVGVGIGTGGVSQSQATATGGGGGNATAQGGSATQSQSAQGGNASATGGDASNEGVTQGMTLNHRERLQAPGVSAPPVFASAVCAYGWSAGVSAPGVGLSGGKSKIDEDCNRRELARVLTPLNPSLALKILCADPMAKAVAEAGDCIYIAREEPILTLKSDPPDLSKYATKEEVDRAFKKSQSK